MRPLTPEQDRLIEMLALDTNGIIGSAAKCGIPIKTAVAWLQLPYMREAFDNRRKEIANKMLAELRAGRIDEVANMIKRANPRRSAELDHLAKTTAARKDVPAVQASLQPLIAYIEAYRDRPFKEALVWPVDVKG